MLRGVYLKQRAYGFRKMPSEEHNGFHEQRWFDNILRFLDARIFSQSDFLLFIVILPCIAPKLLWNWSILHPWDNIIIISLRRLKSIRILVWITFRNYFRSWLRRWLSWWLRISLGIVTLMVVPRQLVVISVIISE